MIENSTAQRGLAGWHRVVAERDPALLAELLHPDAVFNSPVVFTPQRGRDLVTMYLTGALHVVGNDTFTYVREISSQHDAVLEFVTLIDGVTVNGVDMLHFDDEGRITEFTVMLRPLKGLQKVQERMAALLSGS